MMRALAFALAITGLLCPAWGQSGPILVMGDSVMDWNRETGETVGDALGAVLERDVVNLAESGARILPAGIFSRFQTIARQYEDGPWTWVVLDGGANDIWVDCKCAKCDRVLDRLISRDGDGAIPTLIGDLRETSARVLWMGYYRSLLHGGVTDPCRDDIDELDARVAAFAEGENRVYFVDAGDVVGPETPEAYAPDNDHPSPLGARLIAQHMADTIEAAETRP